MNADKRHWKERMVPLKQGPDPCAPPDYEPPWEPLGNWKRRMAPLTRPGQPPQWSIEGCERHWNEMKAEAIREWNEAPPEILRRETKAWMNVLRALGLDYQY